MLYYNHSNDDERFHLLVNGFVDGAAFSSLQDAIGNAVERKRNDLSFEIYDALERRYVWSRSTNDSRYQKLARQQFGPAQAAA